jgi:DNA-binding CsgD family transcriptional regulator
MTQMVEPGSPLTERELQVLLLLAHGDCAKSIARELGIDLHTVRSHLTMIYQRLEVESAGRAVATALCRRIFVVEDGEIRRREAA